MKCALCGHTLRGMMDARLQASRICCLDLEGCRQRQEARDRVAQGLPPKPPECRLSPTGEHKWSTDGVECLWCATTRAPVVPISRREP